MAQPPKFTASKHHLLALKDCGDTSSSDLTVFVDMTEIMYTHPSAWISVAAPLLGVMLLKRTQGCDDEAGRSVKMDARFEGTGLQFPRTCQQF